MTMLQVQFEYATVVMTAADFAAENEGIWDEYPNAMPAIRNGETVVLGGGAAPAVYVRMIRETVPA